MSSADGCFNETTQDGAPTAIDVDVNGIKIACLDWGGAGPAVVLLHPNGFCAGLYEPVAQALTEVARPVAIDLRGHGRSDAPAGIDSYNFDKMAADVIFVLDALGIKQAAGVGGSLGGAVAVVVDQLDPHRWSRLLLAEPVAFDLSQMPIKGPNPMAEAALRRRPTFDNRAAMYAHYAQREPLSQLAPEALDAYVRWGSVVDDEGAHLACAPAIEALIFEAASEPDGAGLAWAHLDQLSCPTTIVAGSESFLPNMFGMQAARANAELVVTPGGHFVLHEDTARGVDLIAQHALAIEIPQ